MFALHVALSIADGRAPCKSERFAVKRPLVVAYFTNEDGERLHAARVRWLTEKSGIPSRLYHFIRRGWTFDTEEGRSAVIESLTACKAEVAFFDPARSFSALFDKGPSDLQPVTAFLRTIQDRTLAKSIVINHHDVKPPRAGGSGDRGKSHNASGGGIFSISDALLSFEKIEWNRVGIYPGGLQALRRPKALRGAFR